MQTINYYGQEWANHQLVDKCRSIKNAFFSNVSEIRLFCAYFIRKVHILNISTYNSCIVYRRKYAKIFHEVNITTTLNGI